MLTKFRQQLDRVDRKIIDLLTERYAITKKIGEFKKKTGQKTVDERRETELMNNLAILAEKNNLPHKILKNIFKEILKLSYHSQK